MKRVKYYTIYFLVGAASYWVPDFIIQWIFSIVVRIFGEGKFFIIWILLLTFLVPSIVGVTWFLFLKKEPHSYYPVGLPICMLLGIWVLGPLAMSHGGILFGDGALDVDQLGIMIVVWIPVLTISLATYSGSLAGLGLATLTLLAAALVAGVKYVVSRKKLSPESSI